MQEILPVTPSSEDFQKRWQAMPPWQRAMLTRRLLEQRRQQGRQQQTGGIDPATATGLGYQAYSSFAPAATGVTTLGGANAISGLGGISGASVTGGVGGAGLGGAGASTAGAAGMGAGALALPLMIPMIGQMLHGPGNERYQVRALQDFMTGKGADGPMGLGITQRGGATFVGGDSNALDRALEQAMSRGITARMLQPGLASFDAGPEQTKKHLQFTSGQKDRFSGEKNRAGARATENARDQGYRVTQQNVTNNRDMVRHAFQPQNIERRRLQGGR